MGSQSSGTGFDLNPLARIEQTTGTNTGYNTVNPRVATIERSWGQIVTSPLSGTASMLSRSTCITTPTWAWLTRHNMIVLYWFAGGIFMRRGRSVPMMGSGLNRLMSGRWVDPRDNAIRDAVLAGCGGGAVLRHAVT